MLSRLPSMSRPCIFIMHRLDGWMRNYFTWYISCIGIRNSLFVSHSWRPEAEITKALLDKLAFDIQNKKLYGWPIFFRVEDSTTACSNQIKSRLERLAHSDWLFDKSMKNFNSRAKYRVGEDWNSKKNILDNEINIYIAFFPRFWRSRWSGHFEYSLSRMWRAVVWIPLRSVDLRRMQGSQLYRNY